MNAKQITDALVEALIKAKVANRKDVYAGRITPDKLRNNLWSVTLLGGNTEGGNIAQCRIRYQVRIAGYDVNAEKLLGKDDQVHQALVSLLKDPHVINFTITPLSDMDVVGAEQRGVQWVCEILTYAPGWLEQGGK